MTQQCNNFISVIIPVYQSADTVLRCIESVRGQTHSNLEIIIVYKESTDDTLALIKSIRDDRIKIIHQSDNTGPGGARNIGIDNAQGAWIGFVEADDYISPDFYEKLINAATHTGCNIAQAKIIHRNKVYGSSAAVYTKYSDKLAQLKNGATFDKLFKTEFVRHHDIRFMESVRWEDNLFVFKALYYGDIITGVDADYFYDAAEWDTEYREILRHDILPVCREIVAFAQSVNLNKTEQKLLKRKIIECIATTFITDKEIYHGLMELLGNPMFLRILHYKKILKQKNKKDQKND